MTTPKNAMQKIEFNTGRQYAANGQPIVAYQNARGVVYFKDYARLITGYFLNDSTTLTERDVLKAYDSGSYSLSCATETERAEFHAAIQCN